MNIYFLLCLFPLSMFLAAEVVKKSRWNEMIGRSFALAAAGVPALLWTQIFLSANEELFSYARFAAFLHVLLTVGALALPKRVVLRPSEVQRICLGAMFLDFILAATSMPSFLFGAAAMFFLLWRGIKKAAVTDPIEREPERLLLIFQGVGLLLLATASFLGSIPLGWRILDPTAWQMVPSSALLFAAGGCWVLCGFFPFSSGLLSILSTTRDNFICNMLYAQAVLIVLIRVLVPLLLSIPIAEFWVNLISGLSMLFASLLLFAERQPRRVAALLFLFQISFSVLALRGMEGNNMAGIWIALELAIAALTGVLVISSFLLLRLGRGYSESCTGLAAALPTLAACFLLCLLSFVGFPGTMGFLAEEILIREAFQDRFFPLFFVAVSLSLNGYTCFRLFGRIFLGEGSFERVQQFRLKMRERCAVVCIIAILLIPGIFPEVASRLFQFRGQ